MKKLMIIALSLMFLLAACSQKIDPTESMAEDSIDDNSAAESRGNIEDLFSQLPAPPMEDNAVIPTDNAPETDEIEIEITAKQFEFDPEVIEVNKGDHVILRIRSMDTTHGFTLSEYDISETIPAGGKEVIVEFDAAKAGEFGFYCSVYCGTGHSGMHGLLIVKE